MRDETPNLKSIPAETMKTYSAVCLRYMKLEKDNALLIPDSLIQADLWGHSSHGIMRLFCYGERILSGATRIFNESEWVVDAGGLTVLYGHDGLAQSVTNKVMLSPINRAKQHGISDVCVRNSGYFGTAMYYTKM